MNNNFNICTSLIFITLLSIYNYKLFKVWEVECMMAIYKHKVECLASHSLECILLKIALLFVNLSSFNGKLV